MKLTKSTPVLIVPAASGVLMTGAGFAGARLAAAGKNDQLLSR